MRDELDSQLVPFAQRALKEALEQAQRLGSGVIMLCAVSTAAQYDRGADLAQAFAAYLARSALFVFLLTFLAAPLHHWRPGPSTALLRQHRSSVDYALLYLFIVHWLAVGGYLLVTGHTPSLVLVIGGGAAAVMLFFRPYWSLERTPRDKTFYTLSGYYVYSVFLFTYLRSALFPKPTGFASVPTAWTLVAVLLVALGVSAVGTLKK